MNPISHHLDNALWNLCESSGIDCKNLVFDLSDLWWMVGGESAGSSKSRRGQYPHIGLTVLDRQALPWVRGIIWSAAMPRRRKEVDDAPLGTDHRGALLVLGSPIGSPEMTTRDDTCGAIVGSEFIKCFQTIRSTQSSSYPKCPSGWHTQNYRTPQRHAGTWDVAEGIIYTLRD